MKNIKSFESFFDYLGKLLDPDEEILWTEEEKSELGKIGFKGNDTDGYFLNDRLSIDKIEDSKNKFHYELNIDNQYVSVIDKRGLSVIHKFKTLQEVENWIKDNKDSYSKSKTANKYKGSKDKEVKTKEVKTKNDEVAKLNVGTWSRGSRGSGDSSGGFSSGFGGGGFSGGGAGGDW